MAFNAAIAAARLGATVRMIGRVGCEPGVQMLRERLRAEGIEDRGLEVVPGAMTSVSAIVVDGHGERQIFNHRGDAIARAHGWTRVCWRVPTSCSPIRVGRPVPQRRCAGRARSA